ncbi:hypothetical protein GLOTRDRAFT_49968 [Gloeophyllum trabeum ATCC 11539]|uniref:Alpha/beta-hydrolase n=1 Tax=Gloeophyllum trabeum (strain ATCC 11539 / FP-39264 / Madison 617) TaxID=670483 RepID=S7PSF2_GLOTA|nr:uncharacterized protein GLOTRDRAFT_49968 [Gloeophyllum trabeum ATCC 11539]EPQ50741.1 hypothetical protein GLOTRDRAFT_49968 [Gloeophyllum trabeum ATCC 11539]
MRPYAASAFGLGGIFFAPNRKVSTNATKYILRSPPSSAPREVPTPLVFLSASAWDKDSAAGMTSFASILAEKGYTCLEIDLAKPDTVSTSEALMHHFEEELRSHIRLAAIPFAPVLVSRSSGTLIAQTYISSNPARGLIMISPPPNNNSVSKSLLPTPLEEFNYEPKFPIAVLGAKEDLQRWRHDSRLGQYGMVDIFEVDDTEGQDSLSKMEVWMDEIGI